MSDETALVLSKVDGNTISEIATELQDNVRSVSQKLREMYDGGLVTLEKDSNKRTYVHLTEKGKALFAKQKLVPMTGSVLKIADGLSASDIAKQYNISQSYAQLILTRCEDAGLVSFRKEGPKKVYTVLDSGKSFANGHTPLPKKNVENKDNLPVPTPPPKLFPISPSRVHELTPLMVKLMLRLNGKRNILEAILESGHNPISTYKLARKLVKLGFVSVDNEHEQFNCHRYRLTASGQKVLSEYKAKLRKDFDL